MPPPKFALLESLSELPQPPGVTPSATVPATPIPSATASPIASPIANATDQPTVTVVSTPTASPEGTEPTGEAGYSTLVVVAIVVVALGSVVLIAWLTKPWIARRLLEDENEETAPNDQETANENWSWDSMRAEQAAVSPTEQSAAAPVSPFDSDSSAGKSIAAEDEVSPAEGDATLDSDHELVPVVQSAPAVPTEMASETDAEQIVGITLTVRELLEFANAGQLLRGFELYSESYLARFRAETGLTDQQFIEEFGSIPAPPPEARVELAAVTGIDILPDGRVAALISFGNDERPRPERFVFVRAAGRWLIDDIASAS